MLFFATTNKRLPAHAGLGASGGGRSAPRFQAIMTDYDNDTNNDDTDNDDTNDGNATNNN